MAPRLILVGQVAGAFGVKGEVRLTTFTADPAAMLTYSPLLDESGNVALSLTTGRPEKDALIVRAREVSTREAAQALRGLRLYILRQQLPPPADEEEYYLADLIGLSAVSLAGEPLGIVKAVQNFGAGDLLEIDPQSCAPSWWTPFSLAGVPEVRIDEGVVVVDRPVTVNP